MKIEKVLGIINESSNVNLGHFHFDSSESFLAYIGEKKDNEIIYDTWGETLAKICKNQSDYIPYQEAKNLYDGLMKKEQKWVSPSGRYVNSSKLVFRLGKYVDTKLAGFIDVYYFPEHKKKGQILDKNSNIKDGFITIAVDKKHRGEGIARELIERAINKAKKLGFDSLTYETAYKNKASINFINMLDIGFKNESKSNSNSLTDDGNVIYRLHLTKEEDEEIMGNFNISDSLYQGDNYAPGDMRVSKALPKFQRRKKDEDSEDLMPSVLYRYMSIGELEDILISNAFTGLINFFEDSEGLRENPAGQLPFFKSFSSKITQEALEDFMGPDHIIVLFDTKVLANSSTKFSKCKLLPYVFDEDENAIDEYEYRLFSDHNRVAINPGAAIKGIIFCPEGGEISPEEKEEILLNLDYAGVDMHKQGKVQVIRSWKPLRRHFLWLSDDDTLLSTK